MRWRVRPSRIEGTIEVPGDKSIGHRALLLAALAGGESRLAHMPSGADVRSTARCLVALGIEVTEEGSEVVVRSSGALRPPEEDLACGNSGTTMRLLAGLLAGRPFATTLTGDASLSRRPMRRVIEPLAAMGGRIASRDGCAPLHLTGAALHGIDYTVPVASAQVKSAILLAGLTARGTTVVREAVPTREHTERMLTALGVPVRSQDSPNGGRVHRVAGGGRLKPFALCVPGDPSSAAFLLAAACLTGGTVETRNILLSPARSGLLGLLRTMGAGVLSREEAREVGEPVGTVRVTGAALRPIRLPPALVPSLIDEVPLLVLLATQAEGRSEIRHVGELRVKETDRVRAVTAELSALGAGIEEVEDGFIVHGPTTLRGAPVRSHGDHRIAMTLAVAGSIATGETVIEEADAAAISWPEFPEVLRSLGGDIAEA